MFDSIPAVGANSFAFVLGASLSTFAVGANSFAYIKVSHAL